MRVPAWPALPAVLPSRIAKCVAKQISCLDTLQRSPVRSHAYALSSSDWSWCCVQEIAETKLPDLNCAGLEPAMKIVEGTAKNMGITVEA